MGESGPDLLRPSAGWRKQWGSEGLCGSRTFCRSHPCLGPPKNPLCPPMAQTPWRYQGDRGTRPT